MNFPKDIDYPDPERIEDIETARVVIRELVSRLQEVTRTLYGDIAEIEERLTDAGV